MTDFSEAVIYKIHKDGICYIGSTHDEIEREIQHNSDCNNENSEEYNRKVYKFIRENGGWDTWTFEVIQEYPCENDIELRIREQYYYDLLNPELNTYRPYTSEEERKKYHKNYYAKYNEDNREEILKQKKQKHDCGCGGKYTNAGKSIHLDTNKHKKFIEKQNK